MSTLESGAGYSERLSVPLWVHLAFLVPSWLVIAAIAWVGGASHWLLIGSATVFALWMECLVLISTTGRRIRREGIWLRVGWGEKLDLRWVRTVEVVRGSETEAIRQRMLNPSRPPSGAAAVALLGGQAGFAFGQLALAWSSFRGLGARRGLICTAWDHDAVHIVTLSGDEWLVAARDPERLASMIREGVTDAQATVPAPADPA
jgi:hypothetical protein